MMSTFTKFNGKSLRLGQTVTADVVGAASGFKSFIWTNDDPIIIGVMDIKKTYVQSDEVKTTASDGEPLYDTFTRGDLVSPWIYAGRCRKGKNKNEDFRIAPYIYIASPYHSEDEEELFFNSRLALAACRDYMVNQGAVPVAPHMYFTCFLNEELREERAMWTGIGKRMLAACHGITAYIIDDNGSKGVEETLELAAGLGMTPTFHRMTREEAEDYIDKILG